MARIGAFSDSHEHIAAIAEAVNLFNHRNLDMVIHCGDLISPIMVRELRNLKPKLHFVFGNNDGERLILEKSLRESGASVYVGPSTIEAGGSKILFMHEPVCIEQLAGSGDFDLILFGHTHNAVNELHGRTRVVNPGETCGLLTGQKTIAVIDTEGECEVIRL
ncbi:MAG: metallophosphoesterase [Candidatus Wallbacteria bacterium]|nr:metallophosphoesterase [Candidatus Wallbacteria bacterium]